MAQPTKYTQNYDYSDELTTTQVPGAHGAHLDTEFAELKATTDEVIDNLALIQRDDGQLANNTVGADQLKDEIVLGLNRAVDWATATAYSVNDAVWSNRILYRCLVAHTSGVFADDLAAAKWAELVDMDQWLSVAEGSATAAAASASDAAASATSASDSAAASSASAAAASDSAIQAAQSAASLALPDPAVDDTYLKRVGASYVAMSPDDVAYDLRGDVEARGANTELGVADYGKTIIATSTFTQTFAAAATLGAGWWCRYVVTSGTVTHDPSGTEEMDGSTTVAQSAGEGWIIVCDGTGFKTVGRANINALTADSSPDPAADYVMTYDASASQNKKALISSFPALRSGTAQASTSGTAVDFADIPAGVRHITVSLSGVSTNAAGGANIVVQIGDSGGLETSGYTGASSLLGASTVSTVMAGAGGFFATSGSVVAAAVFTGTMVLSLQDSANNTWVASSQVARTDSQTIFLYAGNKSLSAVLDRVRVTTANGTDTFDAGSINILYE